jgi:hypothetical protein
MFERLSRKLDDATRAMILGQTVKKRAYQLRQLDSQLSDEEAQRIAAGEALNSARSEGVDMLSTSEVREWSERFLRGG